MQVNTQTSTAFCPDCEERIPVPHPRRVGQKITCPNCWAYLEIISASPLKLNWDEGELEYEDYEDDPDEDDF